MPKPTKVLPCRHCGGRPALLPDGHEYEIRSLGGDHRPFLYKCFRCKKKSEITAAQFAYLPASKKSVD